MSCLWSFVKFSQLQLDWIYFNLIQWPTGDMLQIKKSLQAIKWQESFDTHWFEIHFTALFINMRILKFKSQLTIAFFAAVNYLDGRLKKQNFNLTGSQGYGLWVVIVGFRSVVCVSVFQGLLLVIVIMIIIHCSHHLSCHWLKAYS